MYRKSLCPLYIIGTATLSLQQISIMAASLERMHFYIAGKRDECKFVPEQKAERQGSEWSTRGERQVRRLAFPQKVPDSR